MSIRLRLALAFAAGTAVLLLVGGVLFVDALAGSLRSSLVAGLQTRETTLLQTVGGGNGGGVNFPDSAVAQAPSGSLAAALADGTLYQVLSPGGAVSDSTRALRGLALLSASLVHQAQSHPVLAQVRLPGRGAPLLALGEVIPGSQDVLVVATSLQTTDHAVGRVATDLLVGGPVAVLLAGAGAWLLARAALAPVERMRRQAAELSERDAGARLPVPSSRDEVSALARTMNGLLERLHAALSRQRGFVAMAGHELRTPLTTLRVDLELGARPDATPAEVSAAVTGALEETERLVRLTEDLLLLARGDSGTSWVALRPLDLRQLLEDSAARFASVAARRQVGLVCLGPDHLPALGDGERLSQVVDNLVDNALHFAPAGSQVELRADAGDAGVTIEVGDRGPGFPAEFLPRAFDRFSRPDDSRDRRAGGTGLGLAIVRSVVEAHGGTVRAFNRDGGGASVRVWLPSAPLPEVAAHSLLTGGGS